jgi:hypothetical protein
MPKEKAFTQSIPRIYKRRYEDVGMFFWIEAQLKIVPTITIEQALCSYFCFIGTEDYNLESAIVTFSNMRSEYIDLKYNEITQKVNGDSK